MHFSMHDTIFNFLHRILFIQKNWNRLLYFLRSQLRQSFFRDMARMIFFKIIFFRKRKRRKKTTNTKNYDDPIIFSNYPTKIRNFISNPISTPLQAGNKGGKNRSSRFPMA